MSSDNDATVRQVVPVTSGGSVFYFNPSSEPNFLEVLGQLTFLQQF